MQGVFSLRFIPMSSYCKGILGTQSSNNMWKKICGRSWNGSRKTIFQMWMISKLDLIQSMDMAWSRRKTFKRRSWYCLYVSSAI
jgi:hypothetical protein